MDRLNWNKEELTKQGFYVGNEPYQIMLKNKPAIIYRVYRGDRELLPWVITNKGGRNKQYICYSLNRKTIPASRLYYIWHKGDIPPEMDIDHLDNDSFNNHLDNLQLLTHKENLYKRYVDNPDFNSYNCCQYARECKLKKRMDRLNAKKGV